MTGGRPTRLQPVDGTLPPWTLFELAGHFDISIGLTRMLISSQQDGQVGRDRVSFFIFPRSEVAPVVYDYAYTMVEGRQPAEMPDVLQETFSKTIEESRATPPGAVGSGYYALMQLGEFVPSRVVEAVVHGLDLTDALGRERHGHPGRDRDDRGDPGRADRPPVRARTARRAGRRPGLDPGRVRPRAARRSPAAADRLTPAAGRPSGVCCASMLGWPRRLCDSSESGCAAGLMRPAARPGAGLPPAVTSPPVTRWLAAGCRPGRRGGPGWRPA